VSDRISAVKSGAWPPVGAPTAGVAQPRAGPQSEGLALACSTFVSAPPEGRGQRNANLSAAAAAAGLSAFGKTDWCLGQRSPILRAPTSREKCGESGQELALQSRSPIKSGMIRERGLDSLRSQHNLANRPSLAKLWLAHRSDRSSQGHRASGLRVSKTKSKTNPDSGSRNQPSTRQAAKRGAPVGVSGYRISRFASSKLLRANPQFQIGFRLPGQDYKDNASVQLQE